MAARDAPMHRAHADGAEGEGGGSLEFDTLLHPSVRPEPREPRLHPRVRDAPVAPEAAAPLVREGCGCMAGRPMRPPHPRGDAVQGRGRAALYVLRLEPSHERRRRPHPPIVELAGVEPNPHRSATAAAVGGRVGDARHIPQRCRSTGGRIMDLPDVVGGDRHPPQTAIAAMDDEPKSRTPLRGAARTTLCPPPRSPPSSGTHRPNPSHPPSRAASPAPPSGNWSRDAPLFTARYRLV